jgi:CRP/FNR family cyclic AMP-dependent transcriptional regulator
MPSPAITRPPIFPPQWLDDPANNARRVAPRRGEFVIVPDTPARRIYVIRAGQIRLSFAHDGRDERLIDILGPGDWFGAEALAGMDRYITRAAAASPCELWEVPSESAAVLLARQPAILVPLVRDLCRQLLQAWEDSSRLVHCDASTRIVQAMLRFAESPAAEKRDGQIVLRLTHQQLADAVGVARETVSLTLMDLRKKNAVRTGRNRVIFTIDALERYTHEPAIATTN